MVCVLVILIYVGGELLMGFQDVAFLPFQACTYTFHKYCGPDDSL